MFKKIVAIEPVGLIPSAVKKLNNYAKNVVLYDDIPTKNEQIIDRIGDADAVLLTFTSRIDEQVINACKNLKYIGMCNSLYSPESANVDILAANAKNITVYGIRDYGDEGVVEYVLSELIRYLHGFGNKMWKDMPLEITDLKVGIIGLGTTGIMTANALQMLGADIYYYSRTRKPEQETKGMKYLELKELLQTIDVACTCLNKNVILLYDEQFEWFGNNKILFNTSIGPSHDEYALEKWLNGGNNEFFCDTPYAIGSKSDTLPNHPNVNCMNTESAGRTKQAFDRLSLKVLDNIETYLKQNNLL